MDEEDGRGARGGNRPLIILGSVATVLLGIITWFVFQSYLNDLSRCDRLAWTEPFTSAAQDCRWEKIERLAEEYEIDHLEDATSMDSIVPATNDSLSQELPQ